MNKIAIYKLTFYDWRNMYTEDNFEYNRHRTFKFIFFLFSARVSFNVTDIIKHIKNIVSYLF